MGNTILILGESGSGKSTSIRNLNPEETFIINVLDKPLPFRGYKKVYPTLSSDGLSGNYYSTDEYLSIRRVINLINNKRNEIKNLIIDDFQYVMANHFMRKALEKGYDKFTEIGQNAWQIIRDLTYARSDLCCFVMSHSDTDQNGKIKCKTIGKMLDDKISLEGMFTIVLHALTNDRQYKFLTQNNGTHVAKSPMGMFKESSIDNDLKSIKDSIISYFDEDIDMSNSKTEIVNVDKEAA